MQTRRDSLQERLSSEAPPSDEGSDEDVAVEEPAERDVAPPEDLEASEEGGGLGGMGIVGLITAGVGVVLGVTALVTGIAAHGTYNDLVEACPGGACSPDRQSDIDSGQSLATVSTVLTPIAIVAAAVGVTLVILDLGSGSDDDDTARAQVRVIATPEQAALAVTGSF